MPTPREHHPSLRILRQTLVRELETINQYQDFLDAADAPEVRDLMEHLIYEEKEHVAELTEMLKRFDPDQLAHFEGSHAAEIGQTVPAAVLPPAGAAGPPAPALTVGSLLGPSQG